MAKKPAQQSSSMKPFYIGLGAVAVIGIIFLLTQMGSGSAPAREPVLVSISQEELSQVEGISIGRSDAPVVIYEFADFQCPGCGQFAAFTAPLIKERLVEPGYVRYVYYDFPLMQHQHSFLASRAARCANEQERFWDYHDILYARQPTWAALRDATDFFVELAGEIGLEKRSFEACLRSDRYQEEVSRSLHLGQMMGVQGTPTIFVNMKRLGSIPEFSQLEQIVMEEMGAAGAAFGAPATSQ